MMTGLVGASDFNHNITEYLSFEDYQTLCLLSRESFLTYKSHRDLYSLFNAVFQGNEAKVFEILKREPALLTKRRSWTDSTGSVFEFVTCLQYAVWAADADMVRTILECLPQDEEKGFKFIKKDVTAQVVDLIKRGLKHKQATSSFVTTVYFSPDLCKNLSSITDKFDKILKIRQVGGVLEHQDYAYLQSFWIQLGKMFRESPVHLIQSYHSLTHAYTANAPYTNQFFDTAWANCSTSEDLSRYLFKIRTTRHEPFYYQLGANAGNYSWFSQQSRSGLGYDYGITDFFQLTVLNRCTSYNPGVMERRHEGVDYSYLFEECMLSALLSYYILLTMRRLEVNELLDALTSRRHDLQTYLKTLPAREPAEITRYHRPLFFKGPSFWGIPPKVVESGQVLEADSMHEGSETVPKINIGLSPRHCCHIF